MHSHVLLLCLLVHFGVAAGAKELIAKKLPSYIGKGCSRNDPNFSECVVRVGGPAIARVAQGDPEYRIPVLDPFTIPEIKVQQGTKEVGLQLYCKDCKLYGLHNTKFVGSTGDFKTMHTIWDMKLDELRVEGEYNVSGKVLLLPILGSGIAQLNFTDLKFQYKYDWKPEVRSNGLEYAIILHSDFPFEVGHLTIHLENLFNGDKFLGDNMNQFLNENWREIVKDLEPELRKAFADLARRVLQSMANLVPLDYMFPKEYPIP